MTEHPILFSGDMVKAILEGRKTQIRRVMKPQRPTGWNKPKATEHYSRCPYGFVGDRLWVRESFQFAKPWGSVDDEWIGDELMEYDGKIPVKSPEEIWPYSIYYRADEPEMCKWWRPSIHMPRWASRLTLQVVGIRVERVKDMTSEDAFAEGTIGTIVTGGFADLWDKLNAKRGYGWDANPWVWVIEFKRIKLESNHIQIDTRP